MAWYDAKKRIDGELREITLRRFGRNHDRPCKRPNVLTCAMWECQKAGECQSDQKRPLGVGTQLTQREPK